jgi:hypothetical protein
MAKDGRSDSLEDILGEIDSTLAGTGGLGDSSFSSTLGEMSLSELLKGVGISPPSNGSGTGDLASLLKADDDFADIFGDEPAGLSTSSSGAPVSSEAAALKTGEGVGTGAVSLDASTGGAPSTKLLKTLGKGRWCWLYEANPCMESGSYKPSVMPGRGRQMEVRHTSSV